MRALVAGASELTGRQLRSRLDQAAAGRPTGIATSGYTFRHGELAAILDPLLAAGARGGGS